jgi:hypothetical protein
MGGELTTDALSSTLGAIRTPWCTTLPGEAISTAFVESAVNEIIAKRMNKKQQMRCNRTTVQSLLDVRTAMLNDNLEDTFRHRYPGFRPHQR